MRKPSAGRPAAFAARASPYRMESASSTPPAPPPTMPTDTGVALVAIRLRSLSQRAWKPSMGFTGTTEPSAPGTARIPGADPVLSESTS